MGMARRALIKARASTAAPTGRSVSATPRPIQGNSGKPVRIATTAPSDARQHLAGRGEAEGLADQPACLRMEGGDGAAPRKIEAGQAVDRFGGYGDRFGNTSDGHGSDTAAIREPREASRQRWPGAPGKVMVAGDRRAKGSTSGHCG